MILLPCGAVSWPPSPDRGYLRLTHAAGLASLKLEYDASKNPAIFDQLLAQTPQGLIALGKPILAEQQRLVAEAVAQAFSVSLGGAEGAGHGWGRCLAVRVGDQLASLRSQLGNALAEESQRQGLRPMAVVVYIEVGGGCCSSSALQAVQCARLLQAAGCKLAVWSHRASVCRPADKPSRPLCLSVV